MRCLRSLGSSNMQLSICPGFAANLAASDAVPKFVAPSDPAAQWTGAHKGPAFFAYSDNYLIDVKFGVIVDVEASRAIRRPAFDPTWPLFSHSRHILLGAIMDDKPTAAQPRAAISTMGSPRPSRA
jgi:hypothetical protein